VPVLVGGLVSALGALLAGLAAIPLVIVYNSVQTAGQEVSGVLGFGGGVLKIENGFWLTAVGLLIVVAGAGLGLVTAILGKLVPRGRGEG
jgi:hypothetical protein